MRIQPQHHGWIRLGIALFSAVAAFYIASALYPPEYSDFAGVLRVFCLLSIFVFVFGLLLCLFWLFLALTSRK